MDKEYKGTIIPEDVVGIQGIIAQTNDLKFVVLRDTKGNRRYYKETPGPKNALRTVGDTVTFPSLDGHDMTGASDVMKGDK